MVTAIIVFGALVAVVGVIIIINPELIFGFLKQNIQKTSLHITAVVVRLLLGVLLISSADVSRFPLVVEVLGWLSIVAALVFAAVGRRNFIRLMSWALSLSQPMGRLGGVFASGFGGFLVYAFV